MRIRDRILTAILWLLYLYLIRETFILAYMSFDWVVFGVYHPELHAFKALLITLAFYSLSILVLSFIFIGWAFYNQVRFRGKERRKPIASITVADIGAMYKFPPEQISKWQNARVLTIRHDGNGKLMDVTMNR